jgi:predicted RNA-binding Zn-ribbon protein involved in translation (DUF1610 family)
MNQADARWVSTPFVIDSCIVKSVPTDLTSRWAGFEADLHKKFYKIFSQSLPFRDQSCSVIFKRIWEAKLADAEECPTCGGLGFVTLRVDPQGEPESVAFVRFECPRCGGIGRITPSALDDPK